MEYITTEQAAEKWGISRRRVIELAKTGKIDGAKQLGKTRLIPADAQKPVDGRTKAAKTDRNDKRDSFRYPIFEYKDLSSFNPPLCDEELIIKGATEAFYACHFKEADEILGDLPEKATNIYHAVTALYGGCMIDIQLCNTERFFLRRSKLRSLLQKDFPYKNEMKEYIHEIDATLGNRKYFAEEFKLDFSYSYHESFIPHLFALSTVSLCSPTVNPTAEEIKYAELCCMLLENTNSFADLQSVHMYLSSFYAANYNIVMAKNHFYKALKIAEKYDIFYPIAVQFYYSEKLHTDTVLDYNPELIEALKRHSQNIHYNYLCFSEKADITSLYSLLPYTEHIYLRYAVQNLTHREIAELMHISVSAVNKHYNEIYAIMGVKNKKELLKMLSDTNRKG